MKTLLEPIMDKTRLRHKSRMTDITKTKKTVQGYIENLAGSVSEKIIDGNIFLKIVKPILSDVVIF